MNSTIVRDSPQADVGGAVDTLFHWSRVVMVAVAWASATLFGLYVLAFYAGAILDGALSKWNDNLAGLYAANASVGTAGIGVHFAAGGVILVLGCIQLITQVRQRWPAMHRWIGRVYVTACLLAGLGGLVFIAVQGTIGGAVMNAGFALYGVLMTLCAWQAFRHARALRFELHRAWAMRLFALAIGSWLYRMDYGFWLLAAHGVGHTESFSGAFDHFMAFFFYLPNLVLVEVLLRSQRSGSRIGKLSASLLFVVATVLVSVGTYYFARFYWGPAILQRFGV